MKSSRIRALALMSLLTMSLLAACGDSEQPSTAALSGDDGLLRYVPAESPFVFAKPGDIPDDVLDKFEPYMDEMLKSYHSILRATVENAYAEAKANDSEVSAYEDLLPVLDELGGLMSIDGLRDAGIERNADGAIYGVGLLPVMRVELSDGDLLEAAILRLEARANQKMSVATIDGQSYRYAGDDEGRVVVAIIDNNLVMSIIPATLPESQIREVLGLTLPAGNIAQGGVLGAIATKYSFNDYMIGLVDFERIAATFLDSQSGVNAELLSLMEYDASELTDVCKAEIRTLASVSPRLVWGYSELTTSNMASKMVFELRSDIASGVATLTGAVPGLGSAQGGIASFGMSADLLAARTFYSDRLDALEADPYECELLAEFQNGVLAGREMLQQPIPPVAYGFKGFLAVLEDFEGLNIAAGQPPTSADMRLLIAMDNAESLLAMGAMFSPELAALNLETGGDPVKLEMAQIEATGMDVYIAMADDALAVSVGEGMQDGLGGMLQATASDPSPFMVLDMDVDRYYSIMGEVIAAAQVADDNSLPEINAAVQSMYRSLQDLMDRARLTVRFTSNGIEIESEVSLAD